MDSAFIGSSLLLIPWPYHFFLKDLIIGGSYTNYTGYTENYSTSSNPLFGEHLKLEITSYYYDQSYNPTILLVHFRKNGQNFFGRQQEKLSLKKRIVHIIMYKVMCMSAEEFQLICKFEEFF